MHSGGDRWKQDRQGKRMWPCRLPGTLPTLLFLLALFGTTPRLLHADEAPAAACTDPQTFAFQFRLTKKGFGDEPDWTQLGKFFLDTLPNAPDIFVTRTTARTDLCAIETLSVSDQTAQTASIKAFKVTNKEQVRKLLAAEELQEHQQREMKRRSRRKSKIKRRTRSSGTALYAIVSVSGSSNIQTVKLKDVEANLEERLGRNVRVMAALDKGSVGLQSFKSQGLSGMPPRTYTFAPYATSPTFKDYVPVIIADPNYKGEIPFDLVAVSNAAKLKPSACSITNIYRSPRKTESWSEVTGLESYMFSINSGLSGVRLGLNLGTSLYYNRLRNQWNLGGSLSTNQAIQDFFRKIGFTLTGKRGLGDTTTSTSSSSSSSNETTPGAPVLDGTEGDDSFSTQNYATQDYANDYAILFKCGLNANLRVDVTLVPRINRALTGGSSSLVCQPGQPGLTNLDVAMPKRTTTSADCPVFPKRASSLMGVLDSATFEGLHPEEKDWVTNRLLKTSPKVVSFIQQNLPGGGGSITMSPTRADLKIAVAVSGGGKRSTFNAAGVTSALSRAGILDMSTWISGLSGGAWLVGALYGNSLGKENLIDPATYTSNAADGLARSIFDGTFRANDVISNFGDNLVALPTAPFATVSSSNDASDKIFCQAELKFQSPATKASQAGNPALGEYWNRALGYQFLASQNEGGLGMTFSGMATDPLLAQYKVPLPIIQVQQNGGTGYNNRLFYLWEVTPFDVGVHKGDVHVSYPTALLGTDQSDPSKRCTTQLDQLSYLMGLSSWNFPQANDLKNGTYKTLVCGETAAACQPVPQNNPFYGHTGPSRSAPGADALFGNPETRLLDGGANMNNPVWNFASPTRQADVVFVVDSGGGNKDPAPSTDPSATCATDASSPSTCTSSKYYTTALPSINKKCCSMCNPLSDFACWPTSDATRNDVFNLPNYAKEHTLPSTWPKSSTSSTAMLKLLTGITFFGCNEPNKTAIVYIPNRIVSSGKSGFTAIRSVLELNPLYALANEPLTTADVNDVVKNGQDQLSSPNLKGCLACLFYASTKDKNRATFWSSTPQCNACFTQYCFTG